MIHQKDVGQVGQSFSHDSVIEGIVGGVNFYRLRVLTLAKNFTNPFY